MSHNPQIDRLIRIVEPVCQDQGCELVDLRLLMEQGGWVLRVYVDRPLAEGEAVDLTQIQEDRVDLSTCEEISRTLSAVLDVEDPIPQAYSLEISSPGIDRPLRTAAHFRRYQGAEAKIQLAVPLLVSGPGGTKSERRNFRGALTSVAGEPGAELVCIEVDGTIFELPLADIESARLVPDWDAVMHGGSGVVRPDKGGARSGKGGSKAGVKPGKGSKAGKAQPPSSEGSPASDGARPSSQDPQGASRSR